MHLDRFLGRSESRRDLLVDLPGDELTEHLALAWRQGGNALHDAMPYNPRRAFRSIDHQRFLHGRKQLPSIYGLGEKVDRTLSHRSNALGDVALATQEHDRAAT